MAGMNESMKLRISLVLSLMLSLLVACACSQSVYGSETLPSGVERIRAYCVWDNNRDMVVDEGANASSQ